MLKKLKIKFVLINMCLVGIALIIAFIMVFNSTYDHIKEEMEEAVFIPLSQVKYSAAFERSRSITEIAPEPDEEFKKIPKKSKFSHLNYPTAVVIVKYDGEIIRIGTENIDNDLEIEERVLEEAAKTAIALAEEGGYIKEYGLYYGKAESPSGIKVAFADASHYEETIVETILSLITVFILALITLFFISMYMASIAVRPIREAWEQQRRFVSDASHELKTPLTVILANSDIILEECEDDSQRQWVQSTKAEAVHMKHLVDELLVLARTDEGRVRNVNMTEVSLSDLTTEVSLQFEPVIFEAGIEFDTDIEDGIISKCDYTQMKQLLHILLDNAVKYSDEGGKIRLLLKRESQKIKLSVFNSGSYIPEEAQKYLFDRFYRTDKARKKDGGYGLGLPIAKSIVETHGGEIRVSSAKDKGTEFTVII